MCIEPKSFTPNKREDMLCKIRDENYDGIIMAYSCFEQIPLSKDCYIDEIEKKKEEIDKVLQDGKKATAMTKKAKKKLDKALSELAVAMEDMYGSVYFDELGITRLFVDEAHNYKIIYDKSCSPRAFAICQNSTGGTALPICLYASPSDPAKAKSSGKD